MVTRRGIIAALATGAAGALAGYRGGTLSAQAGEAKVDSGPGGERTGLDLDVRAFGFRGTGTEADRLRLDTCLAEAGQAAREGMFGAGRGATVRFPAGVFRVALPEPVAVPAGVSIAGAGNYSTQLQFVGDGAGDALVWAPSTYGGSLRDIFLADVGRANVRDLLVLRQVVGFDVRNVVASYATRYCIRMEDVVGISCQGLIATQAGESNLWIGTAGESVATTCRFFQSWFQFSQHGPGVDVAGLGIGFHGCTFESAGDGSIARGYGAQVRGGAVSFYEPYLENNAQYDIYAPGGAGDPAVLHVTSPTLVGGGRKQAGRGGIFADHCRELTVVGGDYAQVPGSVTFTRNTQRVNLQVPACYPNDPRMLGGSLREAPGMVLYTEASTGNVVLAGGFQLRGASSTS